MHPKIKGLKLSRKTSHPKSEMCQYNMKRLYYCYAFLIFLVTSLFIVSVLTAPIDVELSGRTMNPGWGSPVTTDFHAKITAPAYLVVEVISKFSSYSSR